MDENSKNNDVDNCFSNSFDKTVEYYLRNEILN